MRLDELCVYINYTVVDEMLQNAAVFVSEKMIKR